MSEETKAEIAANRAKGQLLYSNEFHRAESLAEKLHRERLRATRAEMYADHVAQDFDRMRRARNDWRATVAVALVAGIIIGAIFGIVLG